MWENTGVKLKHCQYLKEALPLPEFFEVNVLINDYKMRDLTAEGKIKRKKKKESKAPHSSIVGPSHAAGVHPLQRSRKGTREQAGRRNAFTCPYCSPHSQGRGFHNEYYHISARLHLSQITHCCCRLQRLEGNIKGSRVILHSCQNITTSGASPDAEPSTTLSLPHSHL